MHLCESGGTCSRNEGPVLSVGGRAGCAVKQIQSLREAKLGEQVVLNAEEGVRLGKWSWAPM